VALSGGEIVIDEWLQTSTTNAELFVVSNSRLINRAAFGFLSLLPSSARCIFIVPLILAKSPFGSRTNPSISVPIHFEFYSHSQRRIQTRRSHPNPITLAYVNHYRSWFNQSNQLLSIRWTGYSAILSPANSDPGAGLLPTSNSVTISEQSLIDSLLIRLNWCLHNEVYSCVWPDLVSKYDVSLTVHSTPSDQLFPVFLLSATPLKTDNSIRFR